jgi:hypothetical protein
MESLVSHYLSLPLFEMYAPESMFGIESMLRCLERLQPGVGACAQGRPARPQGGFGLRSLRLSGEFAACRTCVRCVTGHRAGQSGRAHFI